LYRRSFELHGGAGKCGDLGDLLESVIFVATFFKKDDDNEEDIGCPVGFGDGTASKRCAQGEQYGADAECAV
jgi:hypothetical protein